MYEVYQIILSEEERARLNKEGWGAFPKASARAKIGLGAEHVNSSMFPFYEKAWTVPSANSLEDVFTILNVAHEKAVRKNDQAYSLSVGDIVRKIEGGSFTDYVVDTFGFKELAS